MSANLSVCLALGVLLFYSSIARPFPVTPTPSLKPMDLVRTDFDGNGFPSNARWQHHVASAAPPDPFPLCGKRLLFNRDCSSEDVYLDEGRQFLLVCKPERDTYSGHNNLRTPVTYSGYLKWKGWEPPFLDGDYGFLLTRNDQAGQTDHNQNGLKLEFDSRETVYHFSTPWWKKFRKAVENVGGSQYRDTIEGLINKFAVVTGVLGLDCVHGFDAEVHPVLGFAARVEELQYETTQGDLWALFVRERGNQGFCSKSKHRLPKGDFVVRLPWRSGMSSVRIDSNRTRILSDPEMNDAVRVEPHINDSVSVIFSTKDAAPDFLIHGELALEWESGGSGGASAQLLSRVAFPAERAAEPAAGPAALSVDSEEHLFHMSTDEIAVALRNELQDVDPVSKKRSLDREALRNLITRIRERSRAVRLRPAREMKVVLVPPGGTRATPGKGRIIEVFDEEKKAYDEVFRDAWEAVRAAREKRKKPGPQ